MSNPTTQAGREARDRFSIGANYGKWALISLASFGGLIMLFALIGSIYSPIVLIIAAIGGIVAIVFYFLALFQLIKTARLARLHRLTRPEDDTSGDALRRMTWLFISIAALLSVALFPVVLLIAIANTMSVKEEDHKPAQ